VSGLKSAHGLQHAGENGMLARHGGLLRTGETGPTRPGGQPAARVPGAAQWRVGRGLASGRGCGKVLGSSTTAKRWLRRAIGLKVGLTEVVA
jgi:hypothetical protein